MFSGLALRGRMARGVVPAVGNSENKSGVVSADRRAGIMLIMPAASCSGNGKS